MDVLIFNFSPPPPTSSNSTKAQIYVFRGYTDIKIGFPTKFFCLIFPLFWCQKHEKKMLLHHRKALETPQNPYIRMNYIMAS